MFKRQKAWVFLFSILGVSLVSYWLSHTVARGATGFLNYGLGSRGW